jgi:hypothetical protein
MKISRAILLLAVLFVGSALQGQDTAKPALRTWKASTGQFSIQATFVRISGDQVVLQGIDTAKTKSAGPRVTGTLVLSVGSDGLVEATKGAGATAI